MPLVSLDELLPKASQNNYAVPGFNVVNLEMIISAVKAAEKEQSPIIIEYTENDDSRIPLEYIGQFASCLAKASDTPICVHLDHGNTLKGIMRAIKNGYSSVMYDGANLSYQENVKNTQKIVEIAKSIGVSVEAELGQIGPGEDNYTDPSLVKDFTKSTGISALAVAIGTEHGVYKNKPKVDLKRLKEIREKTATPLVMHGGSGLDTKTYEKAIDIGVSKINYYSAMSNKVTEKIVNNLQSTRGQHEIYLQDSVDLELEYFEEEMKKIIRLFRRKDN
ncbi:MAG: class II fructose-bisphosphate aldolase [Lactococcus lactis]|nr:class II fructose-bisphosphate aldolase [Lactococcus lactis]MDN6640674.1 class II fructose-bisphosphate aldolase [Tetragenococcus sp.]